MSKYLYTKEKRKNPKRFLKFFSILIFLFGISIIIYIFSPLIMWQVYFSPIFASNNLTAPIPKTTILTSSSLKNLLAQNSFGVNYKDAKNWFPDYKAKKTNPKVSSYNLSIPKLNIEEAVVTTIDNDLASHLVNYQGTAIPPQNGNSVVFGHSTLPQLFNPKDYKAIFATLHTIKIGNQIFVTSENITYKYKIFSIIIVDPSDTSIFSQNFDDSYLTLVTCTPPGTTWKRLIVKAKLEKI